MSLLSWKPLHNHYSYNGVTRCSDNTKFPLSKALILAFLPSHLECVLKGGAIWRTEGELERGGQWASRALHPGSEGWVKPPDGNDYISITNSCPP